MTGIATWPKRDPKLAMEMSIRNRDLDPLLLATQARPTQLVDPLTVTILALRAEAERVDTIRMGHTLMKRQAIDTVTTVTTVTIT